MWLSLKLFKTYTIFYCIYTIFYWLYTFAFFWSSFLSFWSRTENWKECFFVWYLEYIQKSVLIISSTHSKILYGTNVHTSRELMLYSSWSSIFAYESTSASHSLFGRSVLSLRLSFCRSLSRCTIYQRKSEFPTYCIVTLFFKFKHG